MALYSAAQAGNLKRVKELIRQGCEVDEIIASQNGETALHVACSKGFVSIVQLLLKTGAAIAQVDRNSCTPVQRACEDGQNLELLKLLSKRYSDVGALMYWCAKGGWVDGVQYLLRIPQAVAQSRFKDMVRLKPTTQRATCVRLVYEALSEQERSSFTSKQQQYLNSFLEFEASAGEAEPVAVSPRPKTPSRTSSSPVDSRNLKTLDLDHLTFSDLRTLCSQLDLPQGSHPTKDELLSLLKTRQRDEINGTVRPVVRGAGANGTKSPKPTGSTFDSSSLGTFTIELPETYTFTEKSAHDMTFGELRSLASTLKLPQGSNPTRASLTGLVQEAQHIVKAGLEHRIIRPGQTAPLVAGVKRKRSPDMESATPSKRLRTSDSPMLEYHDSPLLADAMQFSLASPLPTHEMTQREAAQVASTSSPTPSPAAARPPTPAPTPRPPIAAVSVSQPSVAVSRPLLTNAARSLARHVGHGAVRPHSQVGNGARQVQVQSKPQISHQGYGKPSIIAVEIEHKYKKAQQRAKELEHRLNDLKLSFDLERTSKERALQREQQLTTDVESMQQLLTDTRRTLNEFRLQWYTEKEAYRVTIDKELKEIEEKRKLLARQESQLDPWMSVMDECLLEPISIVAQQKQQMEKQKACILELKGQLNEKIQNWEVSKSELKFGGITSSHSPPGTIVHGFWNRSPAALNVIHHDKATESMRSVFRREVSDLRRLLHPNLIVCYGVCSQEDSLTIVTELCCRITLKAVLGQTSKAHLTPIRCLDIAVQIAMALQCLHEANIVHNFLSSEHCVLTELWVVKVRGFGLSGILDVTSPKDVLKCFAYNAPEVFESLPEQLKHGKEMRKKRDVYSFGVLLAQIFTQTEPWKGKSQEAVAQKVSRGERPYQPLSAAVPARIKQLVVRCWDHEPEKRPTFNEIVKELKEVTV